MAPAVNVLALATAGCGGEGATPAARPLEIVVPTEAETLDPRYAADAVSMRVTRLVHAGLVRLDPDTLEPRPAVAASYVWLSPLALRVELREGARFHSGATVTSRDVAATVAAFASPRVASRHARVVDAIASVDEDGPRAVVFRLRRPHATLLTDLELPILRADEAEGPPAPDGQLDGLGPYAVARVERGVVELAPTGGGGLARPAHAVVVRTVRDENARALRLHAGRADVAVNAFSPTLLPALDAPELGLSVASRPGANLTYVVLRQDRGPFADARVRRALARAIDRATLARTLLGGRAHPAATLLPPGHWATPEAEPFQFDPAAAREELARAGVGRVRATWLTSTDRLRVSLARAIAQDARAAGFDLDVVPLELGAMLARLGAGDFELASLQLPELTEPNVLRVFLHSESVPPAGANRGRARDARLDALLDAGERTQDRAERARIYRELEARARDVLPIVPLWHEEHVTVTSARARAFAPSAEGRWLALAAVP